jgi:hypothetical protein
VVAEGDGEYYVAWFHDGTVSLAWGPDRVEVMGFAEAYLEVVNE